MRGPQAFILVLIDEPLRLFRRPARFVEVELTDHALDHAQLVIAVENLKSLRKLCRLMVRAQHAVGEAVESAYPHRRRGDTQ